MWTSERGTGGSRLFICEGASPILYDIYSLMLLSQAEMETLKYFPRSNSSKEVRDRLVQACTRLGVTFRYDASVEGIRAAPGGRQGNTAKDGEGGSRPGSASSSNGAVDHSPGSGLEDIGQDRDQSHESSSTSTGRSPANHRGDSATPSTGWVCELKDGTRHRCDRLVRGDTTRTQGNCICLIYRRRAHAHFEDGALLDCNNDTADLGMNIHQLAMDAHTFMYGAGGCLRGAFLPRRRD